jgi:predicted  nucleic acid-binding Zn-ribbon protein
MTNIDNLIEAARQDHLALDAEIDDLRTQRRQINAKIKELAARKIVVSRIVRAATPRRQSVPHE